MLCSSHGNHARQRTFGVQMNLGRRPRWARISLALSLALAAIHGAGCSTRAWYEGMKTSAQNECRRRAPGDVDACLSRLNTMSYEEYEKNRLGKQP